MFLKSRRVVSVCLAVLCIFVLTLVLILLFAKPKIMLNGEEVVKTSYGGKYKELGATASFLGFDCSDEIKITQKIDNNSMGTYEVKYQVEKNGKLASVKRTVEVIDDKGPKIKLNGHKHVTVAKFADFKELGATAEDDFDGDLSSEIKSRSIQINERTKKIQYYAKDKSGNVGTASRYIIQKTISPVEKQNKSLVKKVADKKDLKEMAEGHKIYLTFDDGPSSERTDEILTILKKNKIKATFFIVNYDKAGLKTIKRMIKDGHTVAIHGYTHDYSRLYASESAFMENINKLRRKLKKDTGYDAFIIRFPGGSSNTISRRYSKGIMSKLTKKVEDEGLVYYDWNVDSGDAEGNCMPLNMIINRVEVGITANNHSVVLMHDTNVKKTTAQALPTIIKYAKNKGYKFLPLTDSSMPTQHAVNN